MNTIPRDPMPFQGWDEELETADSLEILRLLALRHAYMGGATGLQIAQLIERSDWSGLSTFELDLGAEWDVFHLIHCRQALAFFTKLESLPLGIDRQAVAFEKFLESESRCAATNRLLRGTDLVKFGVEGSPYCPLPDDGNHSSLLPSVVTLLERARRKIFRVLGSAPGISRLRLRFGPGATTALKRSDAHPCFKMGQGLACSSNLLLSGRLQSLLREIPHWVDSFTQTTEIESDEWEVSKVVVDVVPGKLGFVPKNAKTYRSVMIEPVLNSMLQLGIGAYIEDRLRRAEIGCDVKDQSRNAGMALRGSLSGDLATLDLSSASDLISYELVKRLVPDDWFQLLCAARTSICSYKGREFRLEKFSSMGNGFTFPLETLIFWAISTAAMPEDIPVSDVGVYGDDIVVPSRGVRRVIWALHACGFSVNFEKSFVDGPFRESCGKDYYKGFNVRPYFQKRNVSPESLFVLHNYYYRLGDTESASVVKSLIPRHLRLYGPDGYGDGHLLSTDYPKRVKAEWQRKGYSGHAFETFHHCPRRKLTRYPGDYITPLYTTYISGRAPLLHPRIPIDDLQSMCEQLSVKPQQGEAFALPFWPVPGSRGYKRTQIYILG